MICVLFVISCNHEIINFVHIKLNDFVIRPELVENLFQLPENLFQLHKNFYDGRGRAALHYHYLIIDDIIIFTL